MLDNIIFANIYSCFFVIYLDIVDLNINNNIIVSWNSLNYFWKNDQNCLTTILNNSLISNNNFVVAFYSNEAWIQTFFILNSDIHNNNCTGASLFYYFWTFITIDKSSMIMNFLLSDQLSDCIISAESFADMIISNSYFEDNGIPFKKFFYIALTHNAFFGFWSMNNVVFSNITVILTGLIDQISGLVNGLPLGVSFNISFTKFFILNENPNYEYKGFMVQGTPEIFITNTLFYNMLCNNRTIEHILGSLLFYADSTSFTYQIPIL